MPLTSTLASALFGLLAAATWGVGDFCGGFATRRARVATVVLLSQAIGLVLVLALAWLTREPLPGAADLAWGAASGLAGLVGVASLYRAMSIGQMGIVAPVSGVITAALPVVVGAMKHGLPGALPLFGFALALTGVWLVSRSGSTADGDVKPAGLGLALLAGLGFGGFLVLVAQARPGAVFWPLASARAASILTALVISIARRSLARPGANAVWPVVLAGVMDAGGNLFFLLAAQAGRLDVAGVLSSLYPATTVLLALVILRERLSRWQMAGVAFALVAIPLISFT